MEGATLNDVVLDLVQIMSEAADSGRLVGGDTITIDDVTTDGYIDRRSHVIVLKLSNGERVELDVDLTTLPEND